MSQATTEGRAGRGRARRNSDSASDRVPRGTFGPPRRRTGAGFVRPAYLIAVCRRVTTEPPPRGGYGRNPRRAGSVAPAKGSTWNVRPAEEGPLQGPIWEGVCRPIGGTTREGQSKESAAKGRQQMQRTERAPFGALSTRFHVERWPAKKRSKRPDLAGPESADSGMT